MDMANKKVVGGLILLVIVSGSIAWGVVRMNETRATTISTLESAEFVISDIDILNFTENLIYFNMTGKIKGLNISEGFDFEITRFRIVLDYNTTPIEIEVDPAFFAGKDTQLSDFEFSITTTLDMETLDIQGKTDLIGAIISAQHLDVPFKGIITAKKFGFVYENVFLNTFKFRTSRSLSFNVTKIENPESAISTDSSINVEILNPFSSSFKVSGNIEIGLGGQLLGNIPISQPIVISKDVNLITLPLRLYNTYEETMQSIIASNNFTIWIKTNLTLFGSTKTINTSTVVFTVEGTNDMLPLDWEINEFNITEYDPISGNGLVRFNLTVINNLPISIPLEKMEMDLATLSGTVFTKVNYNGSRVAIPLFGKEKLLNVSGRLNGVNAFLLARISEDGAISVPSVVVTIFTEVDSFQVTFSIPILELDIIL